MAAHYYLISGKFVGNCLADEPPPPGCGYSPTDPPHGTPNPWFDGSSWHPGEPVEDAKRLSLSMAEFRLSLLRLGFLEVVQTYIESAPMEHKILWEYSTEVYRDNPIFVNIARALGFSESDLDAVFD